MKGGEGRTAWLRLEIHEHHLGDNRSPIGEMRKVQGRLPSAATVHLHHRQRGEDAVSGIQLQRHTGELGNSLRRAAHQPHEIRRIGRR